MVFPLMLDAAFPVGASINAFVCEKSMPGLVQ